MFKGGGDTLNVNHMNVKFESILIQVTSFQCQFIQYISIFK